MRARLKELRDYRDFERDRERLRVPVDARRFRVAVADARRFRVAAAFFADAERAAFGRLAAACPPFLPPFFEGARFSFLPRPEPLFLPPPVSAFTVAQARRAASFLEVPFFS
jgi:hypothetical protein